MAQAAQRRLRWRWVWRLLPALLAALLGFFWVRHQPNVYEASALMQYHAASVSGQGRPGKLGKRVLADEAAMLTSRTFLSDVVNELQLWTNPVLRGAKSLKHRGVRANARASEQITAQLQGGLRIKVVPGTSLFRISYRNPSPEVAAAMVNAVLEGAIRRGAEAAYQQRLEMTGFVGQRLAQLKQRIESDQRELNVANKGLPIDTLALVGEKRTAPAPVLETPRQRLKRDRRKARGNMASVTFEDDDFNQPPDPLAKQAVKALLERRLAEANLEVVTALQQSGDESAVDSDGKKAALVTRLIADLDRDQATYASSQAILGSQQPEMLGLTAQMNEIRRELTAERLRETERLGTTVKLARTDEAAITAAIVVKRKQMTEIEQGRLKNSLLRLGLALDMAVYESLREKILSAPIDAGLGASGVDVVSQADVPLSPMPRPLLQVTLGAGFAGLVLGLVLSKFVDFRQATLWDVAELEDVVDLGVLSIVPKARRSRVRKKSAPPEESSGVFASQNKFAVEAFRDLRQTLLLSMMASDPRVVLFTSAIHSEGRTTCAAGFALALAQAGQRVLLIDCDLRGPAIHQRFNLPAATGLSSAIQDNLALDQVVRQVPGIDGLDVVVAGPVPFSPSALLSSAAMERLLTRARADYSYVVLDTAPVLASTDALMLSQFSDISLVVAGYGRVKLQSIRLCCELLTRAQAPLAGLVINDAPLNEAS